MSLREDLNELLAKARKHPYAYKYYEEWDEFDFDYPDPAEYAQELHWAWSKGQLVTKEEELVWREIAETYAPGAVFRQGLELTGEKEEWENQQSDEDE